MTVVEKIEEVMTWNGVQQKDLARLTGLSKSTISSYMRGVNKISLEATQKIADALGVSLWTLLNGEPMAVTPGDLTSEEREIVSAYRELDAEGRNLISCTLHTLNGKKSKNG